MPVDLELGGRTEVSTAAVEEVPAPQVHRCRDLTVLGRHETSVPMVETVVARGDLEQPRDPERSFEDLVRAPPSEGELIGAVELDLDVVHQVAGFQ